VLYKTTAAFLRSFGLSSLNELPPNDGAVSEAYFGELQMALEGFESEVQP
jgi:chromosome segregation and condensation protein ScpB